jgi:phage terminase large subunit-like protein
VYADCTWKTDQDIRAIMTRIWHRSSRPDDSKRKYLNWPVVTEDAWCDPQAWQQLAHPRELVEGERVVIFFDGSKTRDATAAVGCCMDDGYIFTIGVWEPIDEVPVNAEEIDNRIISAFDFFDVVGFFADVKEWEGYAKTTWPERWADDLQLWAIPGGKMPEPIAWDMRSHSREFALAAELVETEIKEKMFFHDDHPVVARHVGNAHKYETHWNGAISVKKETPNSPNKIDACVCVIGARMVYRLALAGTSPEEPSEAFAIKRW